MKLIFGLGLILLLSACSPNDRVITSQTLTIPTMPPSMFNCPVIERWPNSEELTDLEVARLLVELRRNNTLCRNSMDAIREFLQRAQRITQDSNSSPR